MGTIFTTHTILLQPPNASSFLGLLKLLTNYNNEKSTRFSKIAGGGVILFLLLVVSSFVSPSVSKAQVPPELQCPTNIPPTEGQTGYVGWTNKSDIVNYGGSYDCYARVWFCERFVNGVWQFSITKIDIIDGNSCMNLPWVQIIENVRKKLMLSKDAEPCGPNNVTVQCEVYTGQCVRFYENEAFLAYLLFCGDAHCMKSCELCEDANETPILINCTYVSLGTPDCEAIQDFESITPNNVVTHTSHIDQTNYDYYNHCFFFGCPEY